MSNVIRVIVAEDSPVITQLLCAILNAESDIRVIACAKNGAEAVELTKQLKPDLITMDICMPIMDGLEATKKIMEQCPTPIIVITSHANDHELEGTFDALQAGALYLIEKPQLNLNDGFAGIKRLLVNSVRTLAQVHVVKRKKTPVIVSSLPPVSLSKQSNVKIIALGSSTGGPGTLKSILSSLPAALPIPIVVTQHITKGFLQGLVNWLQKSCQLTIEIARNNQILQPGYVYFAADDNHLLIKKGRGPIAILDDTNTTSDFKPSVNVLFSSIAVSYPNAAIGGLLTGMGKDGAQGLLEMKEAGCHTFAQSEASCVIYGMPRQAIECKATNHSIDLNKIPEFLTRIIYEKGLLL